jgi:3-oxosteroid 1-dehydrogenase
MLTIGTPRFWLAFSGFDKIRRLKDREALTPQSSEIREDIAMATIARKSAAPAPAKGKFDGEFDVVVVGSGVAGLATALFSRWQGNTVLVLEKAAALGGTTRKAAFWYWVPNNAAMRAAGTKDPKKYCIRYMARLARPEAYDAKAPKFGMTDWEYSQYEAIYDKASIATELLRKKGALEYRHCDFVPDYWAELPEDKAPKGRVLLPKDARETMSDGGEVAIRTMSAAAKSDGIDIRSGHRVQRVIRNRAGEIIGVEADTAKGRKVRFFARKGVVFCTGGFTHDLDLRKNYLSAPVYGGCAARTNEGDFVYVASAVGAQLRNMNYAWMCPIVFEKAIAKDPGLSGTFSPSGDSMIYVSKEGRRVANEKLAYNEMAQVFFQWDGARSEYPNLLLIAIWDQRSQDHSASDEYGRFIVPPGKDDAHVIKGDTLAALSRAIGQRLARYERVTGGLKLAPEFEKTLAASVERFNGFASGGRDFDFHRGERQVEHLFNGSVAPSPSAPNPTMYPISNTGPYYAALLTGGTLDTKGGPKTNVSGQVLDDQDKPIGGLYGVGNCVASASARAYWAGGATIGPILAFCHLAAAAVHKERKKRAI